MGPNVLKFLLKNGLDPNQKSTMQWNYGNTAVETIALGFKYEDDKTVECLRVLLEHGTEDDLGKVLERMQNEMEYGGSDDRALIKKFRRDPEGGYAFVKGYLPEFTKPRAFALLKEYAARQAR